MNMCGTPDASPPNVHFIARGHVVETWFAFCGPLERLSFKRRGITQGFGYFPLIS